MIKVNKIKLYNSIYFLISTDDFLLFYLIIKQPKKKNYK